MAAGRQAQAASQGARARSGFSAPIRAPLWRPPGSSSPRATPHALRSSPFREIRLGRRQWDRAGPILATASVAAGLLLLLALFFWTRSGRRRRRAPAAAQTQAGRRRPDPGSGPEPGRHPRASGLSDRAARRPEDRDERPNRADDAGTTGLRRAASRRRTARPATNCCAGHRLLRDRTTPRQWSCSSGPPGSSPARPRSSRPWLAPSTTAASTIGRRNGSPSARGRSVCRLWLSGAGLSLERLGR